MPTFLAQRAEGAGLMLLDPERGVVGQVPGGADLVADEVLERDGWLTLGYNMRAWSLPATCDRPPKLLAGLHPAVHQDPALLWLNDPGQRAFSVDHAGRETGEQLDLPSGSWLVGSFEGQCVTWNPEAGRSTWHGQSTSREVGHFFVQHVHGQHAFLLETGGGRSAAVLDIETGDVQSLPLEAGTWDILSRLSTDGALVATTIQPADPGPRRPEGMSMREWLPLFRAQPKRAPERELCIVTLAAAKVRTASTTLPDLPRMVWSADSRRLVCQVEAGMDSTWTSFTPDCAQIEITKVPSQWPIAVAEVPKAVVDGSGSAMVAAVARVLTFGRRSK